MRLAAEDVVSLPLFRPTVAGLLSAGPVTIEPGSADEAEPSPENDAQPLDAARHTARPAAPTWMLWLALVALAASLAMLGVAVRRRLKRDG